MWVLLQYVGITWKLCGFHVGVIGDITPSVRLQQGSAGCWREVFQLDDEDKAGQRSRWLLAMGFPTNNPYYS